MIPSTDYCNPLPTLLNSQSICFRIDLDTQAAKSDESKIKADLQLKTQVSKEENVGVSKYEQIYPIRFEFLEQEDLK